MQLSLKLKSWWRTLKTDIFHSRVVGLTHLLLYVSNTAYVTKSDNFDQEFSDTIFKPSSFSRS